MAGRIDVFLRKILDSSRNPDPKNSTVNVTDRMKRLSFDIVSRLAFGYPLDSQTNRGDGLVSKAISAGSYLHNMALHCPPFRYLHIFELAAVTNWAQLYDYHILVTQMISSRLSQDKDAVHDFYSIVSDELDTEADEKIGSHDLWAEAVFFLPAGGDTVSTALSGLFFYLSRNPESYQKLATEIRTTFTSGADIQGGQKLSGCRYLRACFDEALRMSPPVSGTLWREFPATDRGAEPLVVDGHVIPRGTQLGVSTYALQHNEEYFPDPFVFRPERWLPSEDVPEDQVRRAQDAFAAFSTGARGCAGKAMAYLESSLIIAKTLWYFDFERAPGRLGDVGVATPARSDGVEEFRLYNTFTSVHDGPNLIFHPRGDFYEELS
ncbi:hypothetical protein Hte_002437 [Hypoxylon texense]